MRRVSQSRSMRVQCVGLCLGRGLRIPARMGPMTRSSLKERGRSRAFRVASGWLRAWVIEPTPPGDAGSVRGQRARGCCVGSVRCFPSGSGVRCGVASSPVPCPVGRVQPDLVQQLLPADARTGRSSARPPPATPSPPAGARGAPGRRRRPARRPPSTSRRWPSSTTSAPAPALVTSAASSCGSVGDIRTVDRGTRSGVIRTTTDRRRCRSIPTTCLSS